MPKFNTVDKRRAPTGLVATTTPGTVTGNGAPALTRDVKSELFLFAVNNMVAEDTFYESAGDRDKRYRELVAAVAVADPHWMLPFVSWLRNTANMRSASGVAAIEAAVAMAKAGVPGGRQIVAAAAARADEPGEMLAYHLHRYGRKMPKPVKRGLADAAGRLYNQRSLLKYDTESKPVRFGDVLELTHATPGNQQQSALFKYAIDRRHKRPVELDPAQDGSTIATPEMALAQQALRSSSRLDDWTNTELLRNAGMTWEDVMSAVGGKFGKGTLWDALIPTMGYMALLRNLRNFEEAGISRASVEYVQKRLADPAQVEKSRQFPYRFLSAQQEVQSQAWGDALDQALTHSLRNLPSLPGKSLILIDTSGSMQSAMSEKSKMTAQKVAAVFGVALGITNDADVYGFADRVFQHKTIKGASVLREVERFNKRNGEAGHGTQLLGAIQATYAGHSRVFILSDLQISPYLNGGYYSYGSRSLDESVPANIPVYCFNLCGYKATPVPAGGRRYEFGGLTDATFRLIPLLEAGRNGTWPWEGAA